MAKTVRLNDQEEKALVDACLRINRELVRMGKMPLKDTELFHKILELTIVKGEIELSRDGDIKLITR